MREFYTGDQHFGHKNIIGHCGRPFETLEAMHETLISRHNEIVAANDVVYMLGDFAFRLPPRYLAQLLSRLNGHKRLIFGNHDRDIIRKAERKGLLAELCHRGNVQLLGAYHEHKVVLHGRRLRLVLFHYPIMAWNAKSHGSIHVHAHSHGNSPTIKNRCDCGVDCWNFYPATLEQIVERCGQAAPTPLVIDQVPTTEGAKLC